MLDKDLVEAYARLAGGSVSFNASLMAWVVSLDHPAARGITYRSSFYVYDCTTIDQFRSQLGAALDAINKINAEEHERWKPIQQDAIHIPRGPS